MTPTPVRLLLPLALVPFSTSSSAQVSALCAPTASAISVPIGGALTLSSNCTDANTGAPFPAGSVNWEVVVGGVRRSAGTSSLPNGTLSVVAPDLPGEVVYQLVSGDAGYGGPISISQVGSETLGASVTVQVFDPCLVPAVRDRDAPLARKGARPAGATCDDPETPAAGPATLGQVSAPLMAVQLRSMLNNLDQAQQRMRALRASRSTAPLDVHGIPLPADSKAGSGAPQRLGLYVTGLGGLLRQDGSASQAAFKSRTTAVSVGADHRFSDAWAAGGNIGVSEGKIDFSGSASRQRHKGVQATAYASWSVTDSDYLTAALSYEANRFELARDGGAQQVSYAKPKGSGLGLSLSAGHDFVFGPWSIGPYLRWDHVTTRIDAFDESGSDAAVSVGAQRVRAQAINAGAQVQYVLPVSWGILTPYLRVEASHRSDKTRQAATARLISDNTTLLLPTTVDTSGSSGNVALGLAGVNQGGWSWFADVESGVSQPGYSTRRVGLGLRFEL